MEHAQPIPTPFPWRTTTVLAGGVALVELVALLAIGLMHFAPRTTATPTRPATVAHHAVTVAASTPVRPVAVSAVPLRPRAQVRVLVLNGNGVNGAAAAQAAKLQGAGYRVMGATDAQRHDYAQSMVLYVPGWAREARRLARETSVRIVAPVDGLRGAQLRGSTVILLLGN